MSEWSEKMTPSCRAALVAVIGERRPDEADACRAFELGRELVDRGMRVVCGGMGGVMQAVCEGARSSFAYASGSTVGIVPTQQAEVANQYVDVPIATGMGHARNAIVVATADVVVAVGGKSGTLSEIAHAWSMNKPILVVGESGWSGRLAGLTLDARRPDDRVEGPLEPGQAAQRAWEIAWKARSASEAWTAERIADSLFGRDFSAEWLQRIGMVCAHWPDATWQRFAHYVVATVHDRGLRQAWLSSGGLELRMASASDPESPSARSRPWAALDSAASISLFLGTN